MANEINNLDDGLLVAEALTSLRADVQRQKVSLDVLRFAIASLLNAADPEAAEKNLKNLEGLAQQDEARLQDTRKLLAMIRKVKERA
jgi:hypothetical protein